MISAPTRWATNRCGSAGTALSSVATTCHLGTSSAGTSDNHAAQRFGGDGTLRERGDPIPASCPLAQAARLTLEDLRSMPLVDDPCSLPGWRGDSAPRRRPLVAVEERLEAVAYTRHRTMPEIQHFADIARRYLNRPNQK